MQWPSDQIVYDGGQSSRDGSFDHIARRGSGGGKVKMDARAQRSNRVSAFLDMQSHKGFDAVQGKRRRQNRRHVSEVVHHRTCSLLCVCGLFPVHATIMDRIVGL